MISSLTRLGGGGSSEGGLIDKKKYNDLQTKTMSFTLPSFTVIFSVFIYISTGFLSRSNSSEAVNAHLLVSRKFTDSLVLSNCKKYYKRFALCNFESNLLYLSGNCIIDLISHPIAYIKIHKNYFTFCFFKGGHVILWLIYHYQECLCSPLIAKTSSVDDKTRTNT